MGQENSTSSTQNVDMGPWKPQQPYLKRAFGESEGVLNRSLPMAQAGAEGLHGLGQRGSPGIDAAVGHNNNLINGGMLNNNPYLRTAIDNASQAVTDNFTSSLMPGLNANFAQAGRTGSGQHEAAQGRAYTGLADQLSRMAGNMAFQNYGMERGYQEQAASRAPGLYQAEAMPYQMMGQASTMGFAPLQAHMGVIGGNHGQHGTVTQKSKSSSMDMGGGLSGILGGGK